MCGATSSTQCSKGAASRNIIAEAFAIAQETSISDVCDATNLSQCKKDIAPRNIIAEAFAIAQETSISDMCDATNVSLCNKDITTRNIIAEAFAISQETSISESNTESYVQQAVETANLDVHVAQQNQQDCKASGGSVNEADSSAQLLTQADILGVLQGLSSAYNLADVSPENQPFQVVMNGSSMYLVGPQNQVYLSMVPQQGENVATPESQMLCTVEPITNQVTQPADNLKYSVSQSFSPFSLSLSPSIPPFLNSYNCFLQHQITSKSFSDKMKEKIEDWVRQGTICLSSHSRLKILPIKIFLSFTFKSTFMIPWWCIIVLNKVSFNLQFYKTMDVDHREAHRLRFPSHLVGRLLLKFCLKYLVML